MIIKSKDVKVYWINEKENQERFQHMTELLNKYFPNHERINAVMEKPKYNGVTIAHLNALLKGSALKKPFIILEDDVDIKIYKETLETPQNTDALFIGLSCWGNKIYSKNKDVKVKKRGDLLLFCNGAVGQIIEGNNDIFRIYSMYGAHAVLYIGREYILKSIDNCIQAFIKNKPHDIYFPRFQRKYHIYGLNKPIFYQSKKIGGQEKFTNLIVPNFSEKPELKENALNNSNEFR